VRELRVRQLPTPRSRRQKQVLRPAWAGSALLHVGMLLLLILLRPNGAPEQPPEAPSFAIEFTPGAGSPTAVQPPASEPEVNTGLPDFIPQREPDQPAEPLPQPMRRPHYAQAPPSRRSADRNPFAHIVPFDLSPRAAPSLNAGMNSHALDLAAGPLVRNGHLVDSVSHTMGTHGYGDYMELLDAFVEEHKYYPRSAAEAGEEGTAELEVTVTPDGTVKNLHLISSSGSPVLDAAWMAVFRDNRLPAFNDDMPQKEQTFHLALNYQLIYRR
jgi:protein TonB